MFANVAIIGVGLIGGSLGMVLRARKLATTVTGVGRSAEKLARAQALGAIDRYTTDIAAGIATADLVVLAVPVGQITPVLSQIVPFIQAEAIITDVGSVKKEIVSQAERLTPPRSYFIGGHPMTGSERTGVENADPYLFESAYYILTPTPSTHPGAFEVMKRLVRAIGARLIVLSPEEHDFLVAGVSHLPHVVAAALVNTVGTLQEAEKMLPLAAGGFRDTTRIAGGNAGLWRDILIANREPVVKFLKLFRGQLGEVEKALSTGDIETLHAWLAKAASLREALPGKMKGYLRDLYEIVITIPDRPGSIAAVAGILAAAAINIADIEILRVREGEGGTVRLGFATQDDQLKAVDLLRANDIPANPR